MNNTIAKHILIVIIINFNVRVCSSVKESIMSMNIKYQFSKCINFKLHIDTYFK